MPHSFIAVLFRPDLYSDRMRKLEIDHSIFDDNCKWATWNVFSYSIKWAKTLSNFNVHLFLANQVNVQRAKIWSSLMINQNDHSQMRIDISIARRHSIESVNLMKIYRYISPRLCLQFEFHSKDSKDSLKFGFDGINFNCAVSYE